MDLEEEENSLGESNTFLYAGFWIRVGAYLIDFLVLLLFLVGAFFISAIGPYIAVMIAIACYKPVTEGLLGATPGKMVLGLKVVNASGQILGLVGAFVRSGIFLLPLLPTLMLEVKMRQQGISRMDIEAIERFNSSNELLVYASYGFNMLVIASCIFVAFSELKQGFHDKIADSFVIYSKKG